MNKKEILKSHTPQIDILKTPRGNYALIKDDLISNCIKSQGYWEQHLLVLYSKIIKPDFTILDAGANIGYHSVQFALLANKGKVYSFEPQNLPYNVLVTNITINQLSHRIKHFKLGLLDSFSSKEISSLEEQVFDARCINYGGRQLLDISQPNGEDVIETITIDSLNLEKLDLIKMDIQNSERFAIEGGMKTLKKHHPTILLENSLQKENDKEIVKMLHKIGYDSYRFSHKEIDDDSIFFHPETHPEILESINKFNIENPDYKMVKDK